MWFPRSLIYKCLQVTQHGCLNLHLDPLEEPEALVTNESSLCSQIIIFKSGCTISHTAFFFIYPACFSGSSPTPPSPRSPPPQLTFFLSLPPSLSPALLSDHLYPTTPLPIRQPLSPAFFQLPGSFWNPKLSTEHQQRAARMHRGRRACSICFSVPGLPHSMFLFHFHPYPSNFIISLTVTDVCVRSMLSIYQWMDGWVDSASWLLWVEWQ